MSREEPPDGGLRGGKRCVRLKARRPVPSLAEGLTTLRTLSASPSPRSPSPAAPSTTSSPRSGRGLGEPEGPLPCPARAPSPDYPAWLAALPQEETIWDVEDDEDDGFTIVAHPEARDALLAQPGAAECSCAMNHKAAHCALCGAAACDRCIAFATMLPHLGYLGPQWTCKTCHVRATGNRCPRPTRPRAAPPGPPGGRPSPPSSPLWLTALLAV